MSSPKTKRRWYQFSMRTLLVLLVFGALVLGLRVNRARVNRDRVVAVKTAIAEIEKLGGEVDSEYKELRSQTWLEELFDDTGDPDDPVGVLSVSRVTLGPGIVVDGITYGGLKYVKTLRNLKSPSLDGNNVTDDGLKHLKGLTHLEALSLGYTKVSDAGLEHLKRLTNLEWLSLFGTNITDAGLEHLRGLTKLKWLTLYRTNITDTGLEHLKGRTLQVLDLRETSVTSEGVKKLQQALPGCKIYHDFD